MKDEKSTGYKNKKGNSKKTYNLIGIRGTCINGLTHSSSMETVVKI